MRNFIGRWWFKVAVLLALVVPARFAIGDFTLPQPGTASTVFSFVCFSTKICPIAVVTDSAGAEKLTVGNPGVVQVGAGTAIFGKAGIDQTTDVTTNGVEIAPTAGAAAGIPPVVSGSTESGHVLKAGAGNLYSAYGTATAAGYLMIFNSTTVPGDGAVTPLDCVPAAQVQTGIYAATINYNPGPPEVFSTGISAAWSTTGCFTKTASATAFIHGEVK